MRPFPGPVHRPTSFSNHKEVKTVDLSTSASEVTFENLSEPNTKTYFWDLADIVIDTDDSTIRMQLGTATTSYTTSGYQRLGDGVNVAAGGLVEAATATSGYGLTLISNTQQLGAATRECLNGRIFLSSPDSTNAKVITGWVSYHRAADGNLTRVGVAGSLGNSAAMKVARFLSTTATMHFVGGRITQYAVRYE